jgi:MinD superfamily P-loop ATPase
MIATIASGKGGTGKTTVAASLAHVWESPVVAVDLDVDAPNLGLFLKPEISGRETVSLEIPILDASKCTLCGACADLCRFAAIATIGSMLLTFPEMCHGCGGCIAICPEHALAAGARELGTIEFGHVGAMRFLAGRLRIGEAMSPPLMRAVKRRLAAELALAPADAIVDAPPGVSCPAVNAVIDSDVILLVTEPTPFGFHDFRLAYEAFAPLGIPMGAVINRAGLGDEAVTRFCRENGLPVLAEIPFERAIAEGYARGRLVASLGPTYRETFARLRDAVKARAAEAVHA